MWCIVLYNKIILTKSFLYLYNFIFRNRYKRIPKNYAFVLEKIRSKVAKGGIIKVGFYILEASKWKYEGIYRLMEKDPRFDPYIVIVPFASGSVINKDYITHMYDAYDYFHSRRYKVFLPYSEKEKRVLGRSDTEELNPDLIFHMNCWHEYGHFNQFGYTGCMDILQAYVPYAWMISNRYIEHFNRDFHNRMWKIFYETPLHVDMAHRYAINKGINAIATGYPLLDVFFDKKYVPKDVWKKQTVKKKRIIWAPHHHMLEKNRCANFLYIYDTMVDIAKKYQDKVQFVFKPHPELAKKLDNCIPGWDEGRRKAYYKIWEEMPNTQICLGEYIDLFLTSDAMIQDCGSFTAEYTCTYKPMLFLIANKRVIKDWNECGKEIAKHIYTSDRGRGIETFINDVVINNNDYMKDERKIFIDTYLKPSNEKGASVAILNHLKSELNLS